MSQRQLACTDPPDRSAPRRVLITDADAEFAAGLVDALAAGEYAAEVAHDPEEARHLLLDFAPEVVLIDRILGDADGREVSKELLTHAPHLLCVVMEDGLAAGRKPHRPASRIVGGLRKPFSGDELLAVVDGCFARLDVERRDREAERFQRDLFERSPIGLALSRIDGRLEDVNEAFASILGRTVRDTLALTLDQLTPREFAAAEQQHLRELQRKGRSGPFEKDLIHRDGFRVPVRQSSMVIHRGGRPLIWSSVEDITDVCSARDALRRGERDLRITLDSIGEAVITTDETGRIRRMNRSAALLTGWSDAEARGLPAVQVLRVSPTEAEPATPEDDRPAAFDLTTRDGRKIPIAHHVSPLVDDDGEPLGEVIVFRDTSLERELEARVRQAQQQEVVGKLAATVAHDFNDLLMVILGNAELLHSDLGAQSDHSPLLSDIIQACHRARGLTIELQSFSNRDQLDLEVVDVHEVIRGVGRVLSLTLDPRVTLSLVLDAEQHTVHAHRGNLESALLSLTTNAQDAMPEGGRLIISTRNPQPGEPGTEIPTPSGTHIQLSVTDNGLGMTSDVRGRALEPFFTTKPLPRGNGLGLPSVAGCVESLGGHLAIDSESGVGTSIDITLGTMHGIDLAPTGFAAPAEDQESLGRILVIDDEIIVQTYLERILGRLGYGVALAADANAALEAMRDSDEVDLVILDMALPGMDGVELFGRIRAIDATLPVLLVTAQEVKEAPPTAVAHQADGMITRPFHAEVLAFEVAKHIRRDQ